MKKLLLFTIVVLLLSMSIVYAHEHNSEEAKQLIDSEVDCDELSNEQLESVGEYYMEQMHPGEAHELMDDMMGGEGSDSLKQMHIQMARRLYCNEDVGGMMGLGGMMNMMGSNMMGGLIWGGSWGLWSIIGILFWIALFAALILLIIWLYKGITGKTTDSALDILKKRYAKGEITKKQYGSMKGELG